jgi:hypothetical protein
MAAGNVGLLALAWLICQRHRFSLLDAAYWAVVAVLAGARYADITRFGGTTVEGAPATMRDFRRYAVGLLLAGAALWATVHVVRFPL